jgi:putative FmdB family regulatory protein
MRNVRCWSSTSEAVADMPMYDYKCLDCGKESLIVVTLKEHERGEVQCPSCGSKKLQQLFTSFIAHTTKKS